MMSSSQHLDPLPGVTTRSRRLPLSPDEAAAVMADNQLSRGVKVLGPVNPGASGHRYVSDRVDGFGRPVNGIVTVNSSINSVAHAAGLPSGADNGVTAVAGLSASSTISGTGTTADLPTPATAGFSATPGSFAAGPGTTSTVTPGVTSVSSSSLTPTVVSGAVPTPTPSGSAVRITQTGSGQTLVTNTGSRQQ